MKNTIRIRRAIPIAIGVFGLFLFSCAKQGGTGTGTLADSTGTDGPIIVDHNHETPIEIDEVEEEKSIAYDEISFGSASGGHLRSRRMELKDKADGYADFDAFGGDFEADPNFNTEEYDRIVEKEYLSPLAAPLSTFAIDVDAASYANMRRYINDNMLPPADVMRTEEMVNYFNYDYPEPTGQDPFSITTEVSHCPWNQGHKLVHVGLQGKHIATSELPASNLVFLLDVSGSMDSPDKLPLLKRAFTLLTNELRPQDKVSIAVYAGAAGVVLPPTSGDKKSDILEALNKLNAGGSTAGGEGIELAYRLATDNFIEGGNNRVILATDGDFNVGQSSDAELERMIEKKRESGVFLSILGFGTGNYKDSKMQKLAQTGNGNAAYIDNILEAKKVLVSEFGGTLFTIAKDVKIQVEFNPAYVKGYRLIGYETRMLAAEDFNDDTKDAGEMGAGHTVTALYEIIPAGSDEEVRTPGELKYQQPATTASSKEMLTVKFRYKAPDGDVSKLIERPLGPKETSPSKTSANFRWSAAVAEFALLLRDSKFKGNANYDDILKLAQSAKGADPNGYREEFIGLVKKARLLGNPAAVHAED